MLNLQVLEPFANNYLKIDPIFLPDPEQNIVSNWSAEKEVGSLSRNE